MLGAKQVGLDAPRLELHRLRVLAVLDHLPAVGGALDRRIGGGARRATRGGGRRRRRHVGAVFELVGDALVVRTEHGDADLEVALRFGTDDDEQGYSTIKILYH